MEILGQSWAVLERLFSVLLFRRRSERALGPSGLRFWFDFEGLGRGLGRVLDVETLGSLPTRLLKM